jgi:hypothetical protein
MKKYTIYIWTIFMLLILTNGCGKSGPDCFKSTGKIILEQRDITSFDSIAVYNNINLFLKQDSIYSVSVEAGENLMNKIVTRIENNQLILENNNTCNWVRSYDYPINVYVSTPRLWKLYYLSAGDVQSANTLYFDSLMVEAWGGAGSIHLTLDVFSVFVYLHQGSSDIHLKGNCGIASLVSGGYGLLDASTLVSGYVFVSSRSSNDCYVNANQELYATIESIGNIFYYGSPTKINTTINGSGSVIAME